MEKQFRQGDVLITGIDQLPKGSKKLVSKIIVEGEATGHSHTLVGGDIFSKEGLLYLVVGANGKVTHQEHNTIELESGVYAVQRQKEYLSSDMTKLVVD